MTRHHLEPDDGRDGFELLIIFLCFVAGIPLILGEARPGSVNAFLPPIMQDIWAWMLCVGGGVAFLGIMLYRRRPTSGLLLEQVGIAAVGVAALVYAVVILWIARENAIIPAAIVTGFGLACGRRYFRIQKIFSKAETLAKRRSADGS